MVIWLALAGAFALGNWWAAHAERRAVVYVCKPGVMVALIGAALTLDPRSSTARWWFVAALVWSLAGDVFLMLPRDMFVFGLGSFLVGHVAYIVGLNIDREGGEASALTGAGLVVLAMSVAIGRPIIVAASRADRSMVMPLVIYILAIGAMVTSALASGRVLAAAGALLFMASDSAIAWNRFVKPFAAAPLFIIITYHLAQLGLVLSLAR